MTRNVTLNAGFIAQNAWITNEIRDGLNQVVFALLDRLP